MTAGLRFFYRHVYVTGLEHIPATGPVIIIANHNSSLMDAALLGVLLKRRAWFFTRGDVFINKAVQALFGCLHMMPVHSHAGGRNTLKANSSSFSRAQQILSRGGIIVFFPESTSHTEHHLLPFRKGVFRLAFDTAAATGFAANIPIVPIGITYDHPVAGRTTVAIYAGKPLQIAGYTDEYKKNPAAALLRVCKDAHQATSRLVLHIEDYSRLETAEQYLTVCRNNHPTEAVTWKIASINKLMRERMVCAAINNADAAAFNGKRLLAGNYFGTLAANGLTDKTVSGQYPFAWWKKLMLVIGLPFYLAGLLLNGLPVATSRWVADKKVYRKDFYSWIFVVCCVIKYFFWLLALLATAFFLWGWQYAAGLLVVSVLTGIFAYAYTGWLADWQQQKKWQSLGNTGISKLMAMRNSISSPQL